MDEDIQPQAGIVYHVQKVISLAGNETCSTTTMPNDSHSVKSWPADDDTCVLVVDADMRSDGDGDLTGSTSHTGEQIPGDYISEIMLQDAQVVCEGDSVYIVSIDGSTMQKISGLQAAPSCDQPTSKEQQTVSEVVQPVVRVEKDGKRKKQCCVCKVCAREFSNPSNLTRHMRIHTDARPYVCQVCARAFRQNTHLKDHMRLHTGARPFACATCNMTFTYATALTNHMRKHSGERPYACTDCTRRFACRSQLIVHRRGHTGEKPFTCTTCQKSFSRSDSLAMHMHIHSDTRPHECNMCARTFIVHSRLVSHQRKIHKIDPSTAAVLHAHKNSSDVSTNKCFRWRHHLFQKPHRCDVCDACFETAYTLACHRHVAAPSMNQCVACGLHFSSRVSLRLHLRSHEPRRIYCCHVCGQQSKSAFGNEFHLQSHQRNRLNCQNCGVECHSIADLLRHRSMHSRKRMNKRYTCVHCGQCFWYTSSLNVHVRSCRAAKTNMSASSGPSVANTTTVFEKPFGCIPCKRRFGTARALKVHSRLQHCGTYSSNDQFEQPPTTQPVSSCIQQYEVCENVLTTNHKEMEDANCDAPSIDSEGTASTEVTVDVVHLPDIVFSADTVVAHTISEPDATHILENENMVRMFHVVPLTDPVLPCSKEEMAQPKSFTCSKCGEQCESRAVLAQHQHAMHSTRPDSPPKAFPCVQCNRTFGSRAQLTCHLYTHTGAKPFPCTVCGRHFSHASNLKRHMRTHTGERPFRCTTCNKTFAQNSHLADHQRTHTGERPYKCDVCSRALANNTALRNHMRTHSGERPYKCPDCERAFACHSQLTCHRRRHTGEKPYACPCGKAFARKHTLSVHMRTHSDASPYACSDCDRSFKSKSCLTMHRKRTHTTEAGIPAGTL